jgi:hypothetical protein
VTAPGRQRKAMLLRLDPAVHDALAAWAARGGANVHDHRQGGEEGSQARRVTSTDTNSRDPAAPA